MAAVRNPKPVYYPSGWDKDSIDVIHRLNPTQADVNAAEASLKRFRRIRDEVAVERMKAEYDDLKAKAQGLYEQIEPLIVRKRQLLKHKHQLGESHKNELQSLDDKLKEIGSKWQEADNRVAAIERDYPIRLARLNSNSE